ncbi:MAG: hypothetical protein JWR23_3351 [Mucilaginibacter sp.]|nr:hypothetical protein [Mucilaginibacter sp.]
MENRTIEASRQFYAKVAGFTILFYIIVGLTSVTLHSRATSGAEGTDAILAGIAQHASAVRATVILELLECFSALVLAVTLYRITRDESNELAMMAMVCRVCESVLAAIGIRRTLGLLWLAKAGDGAGGHVAATADALDAGPERDDWCALLRRGDHDLLVSPAALTKRTRLTRRARRVRVGTARGRLTPATCRIL